MNQRALQARQDRKLTKAYDDAGRDQFRHPADVFEPEEEAALVQQFSDLLAPVFTFIAKGRLTGTMAVRSWVVLYCTSAGHVGGETIAQCAARHNVSDNRVHSLIKEFRALVPALRPAHAKSDATRARMSAAHRAGHPPGVRNLFPDSPSGGSA